MKHTPPQAQFSKAPVSEDAHVSQQTALSAQLSNPSSLLHQEQQSVSRLLRSITQIHKDYHQRYSLQDCYVLILFAFLGNLVARDRNEWQSSYSPAYLQQLFLLQHFSIPEALPTEELLDRIAETILPDCSSNLLGRLYELIFHGQGNLKGVYYTPEAFAISMVDEILTTLPEHPHCLDPSCGTGVFLLLLLKKFEDQKKRTIDEILSSLYGIDSDPGAVALCRLFLALASSKSLADHDIAATMAILTETIHCADTLERRDDPIGKDDQFPEHGFDLVIGNPPYGLSRQDRIDAATLARYKEQYQDIRCGKLNKYMLFIARANDLLAREGTLHFVVPNSWLGIRSARKLRELLLSTFPLTGLTLHPKGVLGDPSLEAVVLTAQKNTELTTIRVQNKQLDPEHSYAQMRIPRATCLARPECIIPLYWDSPVAALVHHLQESCSPLSSLEDYVIPRIALQAYAQGKGKPPQTKDIVKRHAYHRMSPVDEYSIPYLQGRDIQRYQLTWSGSYLQYGPWLAEPQTLDRFQGPRILMREILGSFPSVLQASYTEARFLYNKSVLHILPGTSGSAQTMLALLSLMNAPLGSMQWLLLGRKSQRLLFPKIVNSDVRDFMIPELWLQHVEDLASLSKEALHAPQAIIEEELESLTRQVYAIKGTIAKSYDRTFAALSQLT